MYITPKSLLSFLVLTLLQVSCLNSSSMFFLVSIIDLFVYFSFLLPYSFTNYSLSLWVLLLLLSIEFFIRRNYFNVWLYKFETFFASDFAYRIRIEGFFFLYSRSSLCCFGFEVLYIFVSLELRWQKNCFHEFTSLFLLMITINLLALLINNNYLDPISFELDL